MHLKLEQKSAKMEHVNKFWQSFVIASYCLHAYHLEVRAQKLLPLEIHRKIWPNLIFIEVIFFCSLKKKFKAVLIFSNSFGEKVCKTGIKIFLSSILNVVFVTNSYWILQNTLIIFSKNIRGLFDSRMPKYYF